MKQDVGLCDFSLYEHERVCIVYNANNKHEQVSQMIWKCVCKNSKSNKHVAVELRVLFEICVKKVIVSISYDLSVLIRVVGYDPLITGQVWNFQTRPVIR